MNHRTTLPKTNSSPLKMGHPKRETIVFKPWMFSGYFSFGEGIFFKRSARHCQIIRNGSRRKNPTEPRVCDKTLGATAYRYRGQGIRLAARSTKIPGMRKFHCWLPQIQKRLATSSKKRPKHLHCLRCVGVCRRSKKYVQNQRSSARVEARQRSSARVEAAEWLSLIEPWVPNHGLNPGRHLT